MRISIDEAHVLARAALATAGYDDTESEIIADHMIGCELRGVSNGGLSRTLSVVERVRAEGGHKRRMRTMHESPLSIRIDGGGDVGYLVGHEAIEQVIEKAKLNGLAVAACSNTWYTGMFAHYMERIALAGFVAILAGSSAWRVAPWGSTEGRFGTNPIAFAFPGDDEPIVADIGTSALTISEATLAARLGQNLPEGVAYDRHGNQTVNPTEALEGAIAVWGGHKGSALATCVQLLGLLGGGDVEPKAENDCSFFVFVLKPELLLSEEQYRSSVAGYAEAVRGASGFNGAQVKMPFDRSRQVRQAALTAKSIEVADVVVHSLRQIVGDGIS